VRGGLRRTAQRPRIGQCKIVLTAVRRNVPMAGFDGFVFTAVMRNVPNVIDASQESDNLVP